MIEAVLWLKLSIEYPTFKAGEMIDREVPDNGYTNYRSVIDSVIA